MRIEEASSLILRYLQILFPPIPSLLQHVKSYPQLHVFLSDRY